MTIQQALRKLRRKGFKITKGSTMAHLQMWEGNSPDGSLLMWSSGFVIQTAENLNSKGKE